MRIVSSASNWSSRCPRQRMSGVSAEAMLTRPTRAVIAAPSGGAQRFSRRGTGIVLMAWIGCASSRGRGLWAPRRGSELDQMELLRYRRMVTPRLWKLLPELLGHEPLLVGELPFERHQLFEAPAHEPELRIDVGCCLLEQRAASFGVLRRLQLSADLGPRRLGLDELGELLERETEEVLEAEDLVDALDVGVRVGAVLALLALGLGPEQADLLVVADRARRRPGQLGDLADPHRARGGHAGATCGAMSCRGRAAETAAPRIDTAVRHHSAVCMLPMNGWSCAFEMWFASPEKTLNRTCRGTEDVTIAITNAIESTAPVFCTSTRAPEAIPRRCAVTVPIIAAVLGELNIPEPTPTTNR